MSEKNPKKEKVQEPTSAYETKKQQGIGKDFNFDEEFKKGLTAEEFKAEMIKRINAYPWKK